MDPEAQAAAGVGDLLTAASKGPTGEAAGLDHKAVSVTVPPQQTESRLQRPSEALESDIKYKCSVLGLVGHVIMAGERGSWDLTIEPSQV